MPLSKNIYTDVMKCDNYAEFINGNDELLAIEGTQQGAFCIEKLHCNLLDFSCVSSN